VNRYHLSEKIGLSNAETNISTQDSPPRACSRFPGSHGDCLWAQSPEEPPGERALQIDREHEQSRQKGELESIATAFQAHARRDTW